jgi:hypothetical protein
MRGDAGEGVVSVAIAILIVAFLGAAMWAGVNTLWKESKDATSAQIGKIGQ